MAQAQVRPSIRRTRYYQGVIHGNKKRLLDATRVPHGNVGIGVSVLYKRAFDRSIVASCFFSYLVLFTCQTA